MKMHTEWTDKLSDYLDDELEAAERAAVDAHLRECADCSAVLNDLRRVIALAQAAAVDTRPPQADLWTSVAGRIDRIRQPRRVSLTVTQLAAAAVLVAAVSGGLVWQFAPPFGGPKGQRYETSAPDDLAQAFPGSPERGTREGGRFADGGAAAAAESGVAIVGVSLADDQYDAAVADLERALNQGRGKLDKATIAVVEQNLQTIDQAIAQAREALASDPANSYLSSHLVEARRRKLDLLRRATALTDMD
jgi:tetratricopeptide (TPR) repeat protein